MLSSILNYVVDRYIGSEEILKKSYTKKFDISKKIISEMKLDRFCSFLSNYIKRRIIIHVQNGLDARNYELLSDSDEDSNKTIIQKANLYKKKLAQKLSVYVKSRRDVIKEIAHKKIADKEIADEEIADKEISNREKQIRVEILSRNLRERIPQGV